jgi:hypothetical protein
MRFHEAACSLFRAAAPFSADSVRYLPKPLGERIPDDQFVIDNEDTD